MPQPDGATGNPNTRQHWEHRFASSDWEKKGGTNQTAAFAKDIVRYLELPRDFGGTILDFGCALGDAVPVFHQAFPAAKIIGLDVAQNAVDICRSRFGHIAQFLVGDYRAVPPVDVIISSNVCEHLTDDKTVVRHLLGLCQRLYVVVPYKEAAHGISSEHVNTYDEHYYDGLAEYDWVVFLTRGWSQYGWNLWFNTYLKNILRPFFGRRIVRRGREIMFRFKGNRFSHSEVGMTEDLG